MKKMSSNEARYFVGTFFSIRRKIAFLTTRSDEKLLLLRLDPTKIAFHTIRSDEKLFFQQTNPTKNCFRKFFVGIEKNSNHDNKT